MMVALTALAPGCAVGGGPGDTTNPPPAANGCRGIACARAVCTTGRTVVTGRVTDPAGVRGLYNVSVYVPHDAPPVRRPGVQCDRCAARNVDAVSAALTDERGEFYLDDVPATAGVPIVIELGRFRKVVTLDVPPCVETRLTADQSRLPRNGSEGELPLLAVTTGASDALECLLRNVGIDESEFVAGGDPSRETSRGHVHLYRGRGGGALRGAAMPDAFELWNDEARLAAYDAVVLSCEGSEALENKGGEAPDAREPMARYLDRGGHVFATHFHYAWLESSPRPELRDVMDVSAVTDPSNLYSVDTSFPKGGAFAAWLGLAGALEPGVSPPTIRFDNVTGSVGAIRPPARGWIGQGGAVRTFSLNTPVTAPPGDRCGRVVLGDLHAFGLGGSDFPDGCPGDKTVLTPQQLALEFLLFDSFACVDDDATAPRPPR